MNKLIDYIVATLILLCILVIVYLVSSCHKPKTSEPEPIKTYFVNMYAVGKFSGVNYSKNGIACLNQVQCQTGDNVAIYATGSDTISVKINVRAVLHSDSLIAINTGFKAAFTSFTFK